MTKSFWRMKSDTNLSKKVCARSDTSKLGLSTWPGCFSPQCEEFDSVKSLVTCGSRRFFSSCIATPPVQRALQTNIRKSISLDN